MIEYTVRVYDDHLTDWFINRTEWYLNGKLHREDGPAIEYEDGVKKWYLNGVEVTEEEVMHPSKELTVAEISELLGYEVKVVK